MEFDFTAVATLPLPQAGELGFRRAQRTWGEWAVVEPAGSEHAAVRFAVSADDPTAARAAAAAWLVSEVGLQVADQALEIT